MSKHRKIIPYDKTIDGSECRVCGLGKYRFSCVENGDKYSLPHDVPVGKYLYWQCDKCLSALRMHTKDYVEPVAVEKPKRWWQVLITTEGEV